MTKQVTRLSDHTSVECWGEVYWNWVVVEECFGGVRRIRACATKAGALRAGRNLVRREQANG
jgi:hypothetical protein